jgi:hypothetical protein
MLEIMLRWTKVSLRERANILDQLLSLDIGQAMDTGDTVTRHYS